MRNLLPLTGAAIERYDRIAAAKHLERRRLLQGLRASVLERYVAYARTAPRLERLPRVTFSAEQAEVLQHCYDTGTAPLDELKADIQQHQARVWQSLCAYCGIDSVGTFEHYLPKSEFPEYAVCAANLLPSCDRCNNNKGAQWLEGSRRKALHLYYDAIPEEARWLFARVTLRQGLLVAHFTLKQPPGMETALFQLIEAHYGTLDLLERFKRRAADFFSEKRSEALAYGVEPRALGTLYARQALLLARDFGRNHWKVAALEGMAASAECLAWACREEAAQASSAGR